MASETGRVRTAFATYEILKIIGEGGAGRVFRARTEDKEFALKFLRSEAVTSKKQKRFMNETHFLRSVSHPNIVPLIDSGFSDLKNLEGPFYVMPLYSQNLRQKMQKGIHPQHVLEWYSKILDGVEAAHLSGVVHRDLKPENFLCGDDHSRIAVADFGVASFTDDILLTAVNTAPGDRLANFQYAAPEQRKPGSNVGIPADIFALGEMLNELFTGSVPVGFGYKTIKDVSPEHHFLDDLVTQMLHNDPASRPQSIQSVKTAIMRYEADAVTKQKLDAINKRVIPEGENPDPLAHTPPKVIDADWDRGTATIFFDQPLTDGFIGGLLAMGGYTSVLGKPPESFRYSGNRATVTAQPHQLQSLVDYMKQWLPRATASYRQRWEIENARRKAEELRNLEIERKHLETRQQVLRDLKI
jgi:serine/threonine protein kinase